MLIYQDYKALQKIKNDFKNCLYAVFKYINLPNPTQIQYDIADVLQYGFDDIIIEGFRGVAKSTITGCYIDWRFLNDPENYQILGVSANQNEAEKLIKFSRGLLDIVPFFNFLIPDKEKKQRDSFLQFDVAPAIPRVQPSCRALGIFGQLTGNRAVEVVADDIETSQNCDTATKRAAIRKQVSEFSPILRPLKGRSLFLGTPHTETSVYNEQREKGANLHIFPVRYPTEKEMYKYNGSLAKSLEKRLKDNPNLQGQPTDPLRFDLDTIIKEEAKGKSKFQMQYMLDNTLSDIDRYPLKCADLIITDLDDELAPEKVLWGSSPNLIVKDIPCMGIGNDVFYSPIPVPDIKWLPYNYKVLVIDPSGRGQDELALCILGVLNGLIYLLKLEGLQGGYCDDNLLKISKLASKYKVNKIKIESNFGDGMFTALLTPYLRKYHQCKVEEIRHNTQKEKRIINSLEPVMNQHRLIVARDVLIEDKKSIEKYPIETQHQYSFIYQLTRITTERGCLAHDDKIDCIAMGIDDCLKYLSVNADDMIKRRQDDELDKAIREYFNVPLSDSATWLDI